MLRHRVADVDLSWVDRSVEASKVLKRRGVPVRVEFRRGGDLSGVVDAVKKNNLVNVAAPVAAGKSSRLPAEIAKGTGQLVIHTIPFWYACHRLSLYLQSVGMDVVYCDDPATELPTRGVVLMSNAQLMQRFAYCMGAGKEMPSFVLYMDENHESDAWTASLRVSALSFSCVSCLVTASATQNPNDSYTPSMPGKVVDKSFDYVPTSEWSAFDKSKPWFHGNINGNTLMCIDNPAVRDRLSREYRDVGIDVYMVDARTGVEHNDSVWKKIVGSKRSDVIVVIVDYAFRSSFNMPNFSYLVDSGEVLVPRVTVDNRPVMTYRRANKGEVIQFVNRVGRIEGDVVLRYAPRDSPVKICDVEPLEADAMCLILRLFGFRTPLEFGDLLMATGDVPLDIALALAGDTPLACFMAEHLEPWVKSDAAPAVPIKDKVDYTYEYEPRKLPRAVSCRTVAESPIIGDYPPMPAIGETTVVDVDALSEIIEISRPASPYSAVYTMTSDELNNVKVFQQPGGVFEKPKRVANRVMQQRSMEQLGGAEAQVDKRVSPESGDVRRAQVTQDAYANLPDANQYAAVGEMFGRDDVLGKALRDNVAGNNRFADCVLGNYYYYDGVRAAGEFSPTFPRGYESILQFSDGNVKAVSRAKVLPPDEHLYVMRVLIDKFNNLTSKLWGIGRLTKQLEKQYQGDLDKVVDPGGLYNVMARINQDRIEARCDLDVCKSLIRLHARHELVQVDRALELEQRFMLEYIALFDVAVKKVNLVAMQGYHAELNSRRVGTIAGARTRQAIEFA